MNKKRLSGMAFLLLAAVFAFASGVSADGDPHKDHTQCEAIGTEEALLRMESGGNTRGSFRTAFGRGSHGRGAFEASF